jgi:hypothetical protein
LELTAPMIKRKKMNAVRREGVGRLRLAPVDDIDQTIRFDGKGGYLPLILPLESEVGCCRSR